MATPNVPPSDITPAEFFESWLPTEYERMRPELAASPPDAVIHVELSGDSGGTWALTLSGGALSVASSAAGTANIKIAQSVEDWRLATIQAASGQAASGQAASGQAASGQAASGQAASGGDPAAAASMEKLLTSPSLGQLINEVKGTLRLQIPGLQGRDFSAEITFGGAAEPNATITVDADTMEQIRSGALPMPQAYFAGKIVITGDPTLAMQVGMAFMS